MLHINDNQTGGPGLTRGTGRAQYGPQIVSH